MLNDPVTPHELGKGAKVAFGPEHVAAIAVELASFGYDPEQEIFVSVRVLERDERPAELYYETVDDPRDSGWQAFAGDETQEFLEDKNCRATVIGWFAERYPELETALREPRAGWWVWNDDERRYTHSST